MLGVVKYSRKLCTSASTERLGVRPASLRKSPGKLQTDTGRQVTWAILRIYLSYNRTENNAMVEGTYIVNVCDSIKTEPKSVA